MIINKLIESFMKFPGIGPRQAKRFAYFIANQKKEYIDDLVDTISKIQKNVIQCENCHRFFESYLTDKNSAKAICNICSNLNRDKSLVMIVEKDVDLDNIERTGVYNGKYFVLGDVLFSISGKENKLKENKPTLKKLFDKIQKEKISEVILATSANVEGEQTARYIEKILEPLVQKLSLKVSRLGRGLSTGAELEYIDTETMSNALKNRK